jgi:hypothetical protein
MPENAPKFKNMHHLLISCSVCSAVGTTDRLELWENIRQANALAAEEKALVRAKEAERLRLAEMREEGRIRQEAEDLQRRLEAERARETPIHPTRLLEGRRTYCYALYGFYDRIFKMNAL